MGYLFLAQEKLDQVNAGIGILERVQAGGVLLIALVVAVVCAVFAYWQLRRNNEMQASQLEDAKQRETNRIAEAAQREKDQAEANKARMSEQESLLREMLERDREAQEGQMATAKALEGFTEVSRDQRKVNEDILRRIEDLQRRMEELSRRLPPA